MRKLRSIQVLRGLAALLVVWAHASNTVPGRVGVDVFFVISGFIIGRVSRGRDPLGFLLDRALRIYPVYWIALAPWVALASSLGAITPDRLLCSLTLWPVYGEHVQPYLRPAWSLTYEMLFYAAVAVAMATGRGRWLVAGFVACAAANLIHPSALTDFLGYPRILEFLVGLWFTDKPVEKLEPVFAGSGWSPLVVLGDASYSIYLVHMLVTETLRLAWPVLFLAAVALGVAFHLTVERPILTARRRFAFAGWRTMTRPT